MGKKFIIVLYRIPIQTVSCCIHLHKVSVPVRSRRTKTAVMIPETIRSAFLLIIKSKWPFTKKKKLTLASALKMGVVVRLQT